MTKYLYYAVFSEEEGGGYSVHFPDLPGCITCGGDMEEALYMAQDVLDGFMIWMEDDKDPIPTPSQPRQIVLSENELLIPVKTDSALSRIKFNNKAVKKTLTIPYWLDEKAKANNVNFSQVLQEALKRYLDASDNSQPS